MIEHVAYALMFVLTGFAIGVGLKRREPAPEPEPEPVAVLRRRPPERISEVVYRMHQGLSDKYPESGQVEQLDLPGDINGESVYLSRARARYGFYRNPYYTLIRTCDGQDVLWDSPEVEEYLTPDVIRNIAERLEVAMKESHEKRVDELNRTKEKAAALYAALED